MFCFIVGGVGMLRETHCSKQKGLVKPADRVEDTKSSQPCSDRHPDISSVFCASSHCIKCPNSCYFLYLKNLLFFIFIFCFFERLFFLYTLVCPGTLYVDQSGLQFKDILLSLPPCAGIKDICHHIQTDF